MARPAVPGPGVRGCQAEGPLQHPWGPEEGRGTGDQESLQEIGQVVVRIEGGREVGLFLFVLLF